MNDTTDPEIITASQLRRMFQEMIGADKDKRLWLALDEVIVAAQDERDALNHEQVAELARHFPGLEQAMMLVWAHVTRIDLATPCSICEPAPVVADDAS